MRIFYFIAFIFLFVSCSKRESIPENLVPKQKLILVIADIEKSQALIEQFPDSTNKTLNSYKKNAYFQDILKKHNISEKDYKTTIDYYTSKPDSMISVVDGVLKILDKDAS